MGFFSSGYHPAGISSGHFSSYESALSHFEAVKPIRGSYPEIRPLGTNRRHKHCEIRKASDGAIEAVLYSTPCVRIHKSGLIELNTGGWVTPTTAHFMNAVIPSKFGVIELNSRRILFSTPGQDGWDKFEVDPTQGLRIRIDEGWSKVAHVDAKAQFEYIANRKVLCKLRNRFEGFLSYLKVTTTMSCEFSSDEYIDHWPEIGKKFVDGWLSVIERDRANTYSWETNYVMRRAVTETVNYLMLSTADPTNTRRTAEQINQVLEWAASDDPTLWRKLTLRLAQRIYTMCSMRGDTASCHDLLFACVGSNYAPTPVLTWEDSTSALQDVFDDILKTAYADICFTKREVKRGTVPRKTNQMYVHKFEQLKDKLTSRQNVDI